MKHAFDITASRAGSADPERRHREDVRPHKLKVCEACVRNHNLAGDFRILWKTPGAVLGR